MSHTHRSEAPIEHLGELCRRLEPVLGRSLAPIVARVATVATGSFAVIGVREGSGAVGHFRTGTAYGSHATGAVAAALMDAVADGDLVAAVAGRLVETGLVAAAAAMLDDEPVPVAGSDHDVERLVALYRSLPGDGRLAVETESALYRVLRWRRRGLVLMVRPGQEPGEVDAVLGHLAAAVDLVEPPATSPVTPGPSSHG